MACLEAAEGLQFMADEVREALQAMGREKSSGLAMFAADVFWEASAPLFETVAALFTSFAHSGYPRRLNTLLMLPLFKNRGDHAMCDNHRPISLIHPLGRWFSKCVERRLSRDVGAIRAVG